MLERREFDGGHSFFQQSKIILIKLTFSLRHDLQRREWRENQIRMASFSDKSLSLNGALRRIEKSNDVFIWNLFVTDDEEIFVETDVGLFGTLYRCDWQPLLFRERERSKSSSEKISAESLGWIDHCGRNRWLRICRECYAEFSSWNLRDDQSGFVRDWVGKW